MSPPYRFEVEYDETIVRQSSLRFALRRLGGRWPIWGAVVAVSLIHFAMVWRSGDAGFATSVLAACWIVLVGLFLTGWLMHRRAGLRKLRALDAMRATFSFDDTGLTVASNAGSTQLVWAALDEVWVYPRFWIVATASNAYFTIPVGNAPDEALTFARSKLGNRMS